MRPPTGYFGAKVRLAPWIASLLPPHRTYLEPFAGSLAVLFAKAPSPTEIVSDTDGHVVNFFRVLRERPLDLERACELTPYARAEYDACADLDVGDELEQARRWWVRTNQSVGKHPGSGRGSGWAAGPNTGNMDHSHKMATYTGRMAACAARLRGVTWENRPALEVLAKYATSPEVAVYCDPPYLASVRRGQDRLRPRDYATDMPTDADHESLAEALRATPAAVLLSGYPSPLYGRLYDGWDRAERVVPVPTANGRGGVVRRQATEVVWSNRPLRVQGALELAP